MKHKYKLGDYVEYYSAVCGTEYTDKRKGFVNSIYEMMQENGSVDLRYSIGRYVGDRGGYVVCEEAIIGKLKEPKHKSELEYLKAKIMMNETRIKSLNDENKSLRKEIAKLEKDQTE